MKDRTLKEFREEEGHSQDKIAKACGCNQSHISRLEKKGAIATYNPAINKLAIYLYGLLQLTGDIK